MARNDETMLDVAGTALRVLESFAEPAGEKGLELRLVVGALPPVAISYDAFSSSLRGLLRRTIDVTPAGAVEVRVKACASSVEVSVVSDRITDRTAFPMAQVVSIGRPVFAA